MMVDIQLLEIDSSKKYLVLVKLNNISIGVANNIENGLVLSLERLGVIKNNVSIMMMHDVGIEISHAK